MTRDEILQAIERNHAAFLAAIADIPDDLATTKPIIDWWTLKDMLGHITLWYLVAIKFVREYQQDGAPKPLGLIEDADVDAYNKRGAAIRRDYSLARIRAEFDAAYRELLAVTQALKDQDLVKPLPTEDWSSGNATLEQMIAVNSYEHLPEHIEQIRKWQSA